MSEDDGAEGSYWSSNSFARSVARGAFLNVIARRLRKKRMRRRISMWWW